MGWKMESLRLGLYLSVPLIAFTMSNWPSIVDYYHNAYRLDVYEKTGIDVFPHDIDSIETIQQDADKRPWFLNLHRIRRPDGPPRHRTSDHYVWGTNESNDNLEEHSWSQAANAQFYLRDIAVEHESELLTCLYHLALSCIFAF
ncbi:expressed conserved protein [Echinococcus multilocularis]|uniref:Expressed conserved protein n=1 Tax=Echinococcus multilocularis TaxID=6211 RepID=A0A068YKN4_ECHMU|nr:expressed conserved protein [Echinococcus multilocularis]